MGEEEETFLGQRTKKLQKLQETKEEAGTKIALRRLAMSGRRRSLLRCLSVGGSPHGGS
jgi:hypothetical protein